MFLSVVLKKNVFIYIIQFVRLCIFFYFLIVIARAFVLEVEASDDDDDDVAKIHETINCNKKKTRLRVRERLSQARNN